MIFSSTRRRSSTLALALALATGTALTAVAIEAPAHAQRKKKEKEPKQDFSEAFRGQYNTLATLAQGDAAQKAQAAAQAPAFAQSFSTADDRYTGGVLLYNLGRDTDNDQLQLQGIDNILQSGKAPAENIGAFYFTGYQIATGMENAAKAREYLAAMADRNLAFDAQLADGTPKTFGPDDYRMMIIETYFADEDYTAGFAELDKYMAAKAAAGEKIPETWIRRGFATAIEAQNKPLISQYARTYVSEYPSEASWKDAIAVLYNESQLDPQGMLDLLRLARRTNALQNRAMYGEYIDSADPRRLPQEVRDIINEGYTAGALDRSDTYLTEALKEATRRVETDKADLPNFLKDARRSNADLATLVAAGDTFLSYGRAAEAEEFYNRALPMSGVDTPRVLTRLGMAQLDQGKYADAEATFNKVEGARQAIASLWAVYSNQQSGS